MHWIKTEMSSLTGDVNTREQEETAPECATVDQVSKQAKMNIFNNLTNPLSARCRKAAHFMTNPIVSMVCMRQSGLAHVVHLILRSGFIQTTRPANALSNDFSCFFPDLSRKFSDAPGHPFCRKVKLKLCPYDSV
jgi:hypothetical protein